MKTVLEMRNVNKVYDSGKVKYHALTDINLKIKESQNIAIIGPSGSGKSTLLHLIGILDRPSTGKVFIDGSDTSKMSENKLAEIRRTKIGFVFQFFFLVPSLTALKNVELPMIFAKIAQDKREKKAKELLDLVGLGHRLNNRPFELSGGERQRVAVARSLANNPKILLADEPTGNLDSKTGDELIHLLTKLNKENGVTLVIITHDKEIARRAQKKINIKDGKVYGG